MALDPDVFSELLSTLRRFVDETLIPAERQVSEEDRIPEDISRMMRDMGLFGLSIPEEYGGLGLTTEEEMRVIFEVTRASPAFRSSFGTNVGIGSQGIILDGTEEQKRRYLPRLASGELIASFCLTEPDSGSDAGALRTSAKRDRDHYVLNGTKRFITNAPEAGLFTVMARSAPRDQPGQGITAFLVDADMPGITVGKPDKKMGQQGAHIADVIFDDCRVPASAIIGGKEGQNFHTAMQRRHV